MSSGCESRSRPGWLSSSAHLVDHPPASVLFACSRRGTVLAAHRVGAAAAELVDVRARRVAPVVDVERGVHVWRVVECKRVAVHPSARDCYVTLPLLSRPLEGEAQVRTRLASCQHLVAAEGAFRSEAANSPRSARALCRLAKGHRVFVVIIVAAATRLPLHSLVVLLHVLAARLHGARGEGSGGEG